MSIAINASFALFMHKLGHLYRISKISMMRQMQMPEIRPNDKVCNATLNGTTRPRDSGVISGEETEPDTKYLLNVVEGRGEPDPRGQKFPVGQATH